MWNPKTKPFGLIDAENRPLMGRGQGLKWAKGSEEQRPVTEKSVPGREAQHGDSKE